MSRPLTFNRLEVFINYLKHSPYDYVVVQIEVNRICSVYIQVTADQLIQAQGPLAVFASLHQKHCLIVGQGKILDIADEYP